MMKTINVGVLGLGTVGGGTALVLQRNSAEITRRTGVNIKVAMASVRQLTSERLCDCADITLTVDPYEIVNNPSIDIVVELIGGDTLAKELVLLAIANGKQVVTANKALIALHGNEIFAAAQAKGVAVMFESSVAGGVSIIKSIREGLAGNRIEMVAGIINGTGNFILTEMRDKGRSFADALAQAQDLGYAEADPAFDIDGIDAAHKLTILASLAFGMPLNFNKLYIEGISSVDLLDIAYAEQLGYRIKHLGIAKKTANGIELRVHPTLIPAKTLMANVEGVMNAVLVKGDAVGNTLQCGAGAGAQPTASAVVADIIDLVRCLNAHGDNSITPHVPYLGFQAQAIESQAIKAIGDISSAYYLRIEVNDVSGVISKLSAAFAELDVSIEGITQKEPQAGQTNVSVIFITQCALEQHIDKVISKIENLPDVLAKVAKIRVEHLN